MSKRSCDTLGTRRLRILLPLVVLCLLVFASTFVVACGGEETTTTTLATGTTATTTVSSTETTGTTEPLPATIKVGAVIPLTGKYSGLGEQVKNGYELAVAEITAAGRVDVGGTKVPLELSILDDESDATKTVQQLETHSSNGVVAYLGGAGSDLHAAAAGIGAKNKNARVGS